MEIKFRVGDIIYMMPSSTYYEVDRIRDDEKLYILRELRISGYDHSNQKMLLEPTDILIEKSYRNFYDVPWWYQSSEKDYEVI